MLFACIVRGQTGALEYLIINGDADVQVVDAVRCVSISHCHFSFFIMLERPTIYRNIDHWLKQPCRPNRPLLCMH
jgi:hypothetical protein